MEWKALFYRKPALEQEPQLHRWVKTEGVAHGIKCAAFWNTPTKEHIKRFARDLRVEFFEILWIVSDEQEWKLAKELAIAALPYLPCTAKDGDGAPHYDGAWMVAEGFSDVDYEFLLKCYQRAHRLPWNILQTERCRLREFAMKDLDALFALYGQPGVTDYMEGLFDRDKEAEYQSAYIENMYRYYGYGMWLVYRKDNRRLIGRAGLEHREYHGTAELEMGYLIDPREQGKGYAKEVCRAIMEYAKEKLDFPRINCLIEAGNKASIHLVEALGFVYFEDIPADGKEMKRYIYCF